MFLNCAGKRKSSKFDDVYSLDVRILEIKEWLDITKKEFQDLDKIVKPKLKYYIKKDFQVYQKLDPHYEIISTSINIIDSLTMEIDVLVDQMGNSTSDSLDTVPDDTTESYRDMIESKRKNIKKTQGKFYKSIEKLKKGFKFDKKILIFVLEESKPLKEKLYEIKYKRATLSSDIAMLNKKLDEALFDNPNSSYSKRIIKISQTLESYMIKLDKYENFLMNIDLAARKEAGGYVILIPEESDPMNYMIRYEKGMEEYLEILTKIKRISQSI